MTLSSPRGSGNGLNVFLIGICLGLTLGITLIPLFDPDCVSPSSGEYEGERVVRRKREAPPPPLIRPRYSSTELGQRDRKLLVGIILTEASFLKFTRFRQTIYRHELEFLFFVNGTLEEFESLKAEIKAHGLHTADVVHLKFDGVTALTLNSLGLRTLELVGQEYRHNFDYFYIGFDFYYLNGRSLLKGVKGISIREVLLWGIPTNHQPNVNSSCQLETGFVIGRSLLRILWNKISRCSNGILQAKLEGDFSKCLQHVVTDLSCRTTIQNQVYKVLSPTDFQEIQGRSKDLISVGPITTPDQILEIHELMCEARKLEIDNEIKQHRDEMRKLDPLIPSTWRNLNWPIGIPAPSRPENRFDVIPWKYFSADTIYLNDEITPALSRRRAGVQDLEIKDLLQAAQKFLNSSTTTYHFAYGYKRFAPTRGQEYVLTFQGNETGEIIRVEGLRPLVSSLELVPVPFIIEPTKPLFLILRVTEENSAEVPLFLQHWHNTTNEARERYVKIILVLVKGGPNPVSHLLTSTKTEELIGIINRFNNRLNFVKVGYAVVVDLSSVEIVEYLGGKGKLGETSLRAVILLIPATVSLDDEFLSHVRISTLPGYQVYSPIPFSQYNPFVSAFQQSSTSHVEINKNNGFFNSNDFYTISFYYQDFIDAKKSVGLDWDKVRDEGSGIIDLFLRGSSVHILRAIDPALGLRYLGPTQRREDCQASVCSQANIGSKEQIAKVLISTGVLEE